MPRFLAASMFRLMEMLELREEEMVEEVVQEVPVVQADTADLMGWAAKLYTSMWDMLDLGRLARMVTATMALAVVVSRDNWVLGILLVHRELAAALEPEVREKRGIALEVVEEHRERLAVLFGMDNIWDSLVEWDMVEESAVTVKREEQVVAALIALRLVRWYLLAGLAEEEVVVVVVDRDKAAVEVEAEVQASFGIHLTAILLWVQTEDKVAMEGLEEMVVVVAVEEVEAVL